MRTTFLALAMLIATAVGCGGNTEVTMPENPDPPPGAGALQPAVDAGTATVEGN